jgi:transcriptional regulator with XRE-family HTH domain
MTSGSALIRSARLDKGLTVRKAAKAIGVTADILLRAENGATPRPEAAKKIADFYDTTVTDIWPVEKAAA